MDSQEVDKVGRRALPLTHPLHTSTKKNSFYRQEGTLFFIPDKTGFQILILKLLTMQI